MKKILALTLAMLSVILLLTSCMDITEIKNKLPNISQNDNETDNDFYARIAKFGLVLSAEGTEIKNVKAENGYIIFDASPRVMAPGIITSQQCKTQVKGTSEIATKITTTADVTISGYEIDGSYYCPLTCTVNGKSKNGSDFDSAADFENWIEQQIATVTKQYPPNSKIDDVIINIEWKWYFLNTDDAKDTQLGEMGASDQLNVRVIISQSLNQI